MIRMGITSTPAERKLVNFTLETFEEKELSVKHASGRAYERWEIESTDAVFAARFKEALAENLRTFWKYEYLKERVKGISDPYRLHALLGVMIGVDVRSDRGELLIRLREERNVSLPAIKCFRLDRLYGEWRLLADFITAFCASGQSERQAFAELIPVLQIWGSPAGDSERERGVVLDGATGSITEEGRKVRIPPFGEREDCNLLTALTALRPDTVTVLNPRRLSPGVLGALQEMGAAEREAVNNS